MHSIKHNLAVHITHEAKLQRMSAALACKANQQKAVANKSTKEARLAISLRTPRRIRKQKTHCKLRKEIGKAKPHQHATTQQIPPAAGRS